SNILHFQDLNPFFSLPGNVGERSFFTAWYPLFPCCWAGQCAALMVSTCRLQIILKSRDKSEGLTACVSQTASPSAHKQFLLRNFV
ncbi:MAG: hypothetical protein Q4B50_04865, partial [Bacillota bacterium]|nr:hypothetical protein [Bacillota bacterium]